MFFFFIILADSSLNNREGEIERFTDEGLVLFILLLIIYL